MTKYYQIGITNYYETLEICVLGHYCQFSITNTYNVLCFVDKDAPITKSSVRQILDGASRVCIAASQRIFMASGCALHLVLMHCMCVVIVGFFYAFST